MTPIPIIFRSNCQASPEMLLSPDFWSDQIALALRAWAIIIPLLLLSFAAGLKIRSVTAANALLRQKVHTEAVEARLELARELNAGEAKAIEDIRRDIVELRTLVGVDSKSSSLEQLLADAEARAETLGTANRTTDHVLNAKNVAIGD
jgi:hypothetical protein